jgi:transposase InsO family protein
MCTSLVTDALAMGSRRRPRPARRGLSQRPRLSIYLCRVRHILRGQGTPHEVGRTGVCWDNAAAESFFATLKNEMYYRKRLDTRAQARFAVAEYIEIF